MGICECCKRELRLTRRHLIPRTYHKNKKIRKLYTLDFLQKNIIMVCRPCHDQIHILFTKKELVYQYNTIYNIVNHKDIIKWISFISKKNIDFKPK